jgi:hypothetical protein
MAVSKSLSMAALLLCVLCLLLQSKTSAYPIITDVDEGDTKVGAEGDRLDMGLFLILAAVLIHEYSHAPLYSASISTSPKTTTHTWYSWSSPTK